MLVYLENAVRTEDTEYFKKEETYSKSEITELVNYGESKGIELIPAFENLGHLEKFMAYPQLSHIFECEDALCSHGGDWLWDLFTGTIRKKRGRNEYFY